MLVTMLFGFLRFDRQLEKAYELGHVGVTGEAGSSTHDFSLNLELNGGHQAQDLIAPEGL